MNTATLVQFAALAGVALSRCSPAGTLLVTGEVLAVQRTLPGICDHREAILSMLADPADVPTPFDKETFEERAAICEFDGGLDREEAEAVAWKEDDRRRCAHCLNLRPGGVCKVSGPGGRVQGPRGFRPNQNVLHRCPGYRPHPDDPDRRPGHERWPAQYAPGKPFD